MTSLSRNHVVSVRVELCCEDRTLPHPVVNQQGITITSLSESLSQGLGRALPYINGFLCALTIAAKLGSSYGVPFPASPILELLPYLKDVKLYPMISTTLMDMSVSRPIEHLSRVSKYIAVLQRVARVLGIHTQEQWRSHEPKHRGTVRSQACRVQKRRRRCMVM